MGKEFEALVKVGLRSLFLKEATKAWNAGDVAGALFLFWLYAKMGE